MPKYTPYNKIENKKYHIVGTILKSNKIITETGNIHTLNIHIYSWLSLSRTRLTRISSRVEFLSKSRTSLCINIYNLTPVKSNSDESKFRLSRIKVLVPRCRKPYNLHSLSRIYLSKDVYYLGIKIGSQVKHPVIDWHFYLRLFHMFILAICQIN
jgi:hypothetical protein